MRGLPSAATAIAPGSLVCVAGIKKRPELNGKPAVVVSAASDPDTWNVYVDQDTKKLKLKKDNLVPDTEAVEVEGSPPEIVWVGAGGDSSPIATVIARRGDDLVHVEYVERKGGSGRIGKMIMPR